MANRQLFWLLLGLLCLETAAREPIYRSAAQARAARISQVRYDLVFDLNADATGVDAEATLHFQLMPGQEDLVVDFAGGRIHNLVLNGAPLKAAEYRRSGNSLHLPGASLHRGDNSLTIKYTTPYANDGSGLHHFRDPTDSLEYLYTDLEPDLAHRVFPCFDQPDLRAVFKLTVNLPADWEISANAPIQSQRLIDGQKRIVFRETPAIATYLFNLTAGPFAVFHHRVGKVPMRLLCRQSQAIYLDEKLVFRYTEIGLDFFQSYFNRAYPFAKYDQIFVPEYNHGAMENPGSVLFNESYILGFEPGAAALRGLEKVIYHEMAHMWFGNLVTMRWWDDLWLNESFASYMEIVALRELGRQEVWREAAEDKQGGYQRDRTRATHPIVTNVPDTRTAIAYFDPITYGKGLGVLRQLEFTLGNDAFRDGIRHYLKTHEWGNTTLAHFFNALEPYTQQDLTAWRHAWLHTAGTNLLQLAWQARRGAIKQAVLHQEPGNGDALLRPHRLNLSLFYEDAAGDIREGKRVVISIEEKATAVPQLKGKAKPKLIIPNRYEQTFAAVDLDPISLKQVLQKPEKIAEESVRYRLSEILWDMMCRQKVTPAEYEAVAMTWLSRAKNVRESNYLLDRLTTLASEYARNSRRADRLFRFCRQQIERGEAIDPFAGLQAMLAVPVSKTRLAYLKQLAVGKDDPEGLNLSFGGRLFIMATLREVAYPGMEDAVEAEVARIPSALRDTYVPYMEALRATSEAKEKAWAKITDASLSMHQRRMWMLGFASMRQERLLAPYTLPYFEQLDIAWRSEEWEYVETFGETMFPFWNPEAARQAAEAYLARPNLPKPLHDLVARLTDELLLRQALTGSRR